MILFFFWTTFWTFLDLVSYICNIFELVFTLWHKCNKYNCLPWKMLNQQLYHPPETVMSHRRQVYHPFMYLFCILIRLGSWSNKPDAKHSKQNSWILKQNENLRAGCSILFDFVFISKYHIIYVTCLLGRQYQNISPSGTLFQ